MSQPVNLSSLIPRSGERACFLGQTGSGKSFLMRAMLGAYLGKRQIIVVDSKHDSVWGNLRQANYVRSAAQVSHLRFPRHPLIVWRPEGDEANDLDAFDSFFSWVYRRGNTCLVVDETSACVPAQGQGSGFADLVTRGRIRKLTVLFGTQRPAYIPRTVYSESQRIFTSYLSDKRDRDTVAAFSHPFLAREVPDRHGFWYYNVKTRTPLYFTGLHFDRLTKTANVIT